MSKRFIEILVGIFMMLGIIAFIFVAMQVSGLKQFTDEPGYIVKAQFDNIGNLKVRSRITISGVVIGKVVNVDLDPETFRSEVSMKIDRQYNTIPSDSTASIHTAGLIGDNYVAILPGANMPPEVLKEGSFIEDTQGALILEKLIQKLLASKLSS